MATGHHFLADAVAAAILVWVAWAVSRTFGALGPDGQPATLGWELQWGTAESTNTHGGMVRGSEGDVFPGRCLG